MPEIGTPRMIDRAIRDEAAQALERFLACQTTNDDYESEYPLPELFGRKESKDKAVKAIYSMSWNWFDDLQTHKLDGAYALEPEVRSIADRCVVFLKSNVEYEWKEDNFVSAGFVRSVLTSLHLIPATPSVEDRVRHHLDQPEGDASVWPFFRRSDMTEA